MVKGGGAMAISRVEIRDFLVFKGELGLDICPEVNVFFGGNGTGKTTLLKIMYGIVNEKLDKCFLSFEMKDRVAFGSGNARLVFSDGSIAEFQQGAFNENAGQYVYSLTGKIRSVREGASIHSTTGKALETSSVYIPEKDIKSARLYKSILSICSQTAIIVRSVAVHFSL